jgi:hypothetical protein
MVKGQQRGNREHKKPKQVKSKPVGPASPFASIPLNLGGNDSGNKR